MFPRKDEFSTKEKLANTKTDAKSAKQALYLLRLYPLINKFFQVANRKQSLLKRPPGQR